MQSSRHCHIPWNPNPRLGARAYKHFRVMCGDKPQTVTVDRLKPACVPPECEPDPLPYVTRAGRVIYPTVRR